MPDTVKQLSSLRQFACWAAPALAHPESGIVAAIKKITGRGRASTVATVPALAGGPSTPGTDKHPYLRGLKIDAKGAFYVADGADARVLKITPDGRITTLLQLESPWAPTDVAVFGDIVYVLEFLHTAGDDRLTWMPRVRKITPDGKSTIIVTADQLRSPPARGGVGFSSPPGLRRGGSVSLTGWSRTGWWEPPAAKVDEPVASNSFSSGFGICCGPFFFISDSAC